MFSLLTLFFACSQQQQNAKDTQNNIAANNDSVFNSFEDYYRKSFPNLKYNYDDISQTHNYSGNWDFDSDGIKDEMYFIGSGGAHLYYYLKMVLSNDKTPREFKFAETDFPVLTASGTSDFSKSAAGFAVTTIGKNTSPSVILRLDDQSYETNRPLLTKLNIKRKIIVIRFEKGKPVFSSL